MNFTILERELNCDNSRFEIETTSFENDRILSSIDYTILDLLNSTEKDYSNKELEASLIEEMNKRIVKGIIKNLSLNCKNNIKQKNAQC